MDELGIPNTAADSSSTGGATDNGDGISNGSSGSGGGGEGAAAADTVTKGSSDWLPNKSSSPSNSTMSSRSGVLGPSSGKKNKFGHFLLFYS